MKTTFRIFFLLLTIFALAFCAGCSDGEVEDTTEYTVYFRSERLKLPENFATSGNLSLAGGNLLIRGVSTDDEPDPDDPDGYAEQKRLLLTIDLATGEQTLTEQTDGGEDRLFGSFYLKSGDRFDFRIKLKDDDSGYESASLTRVRGDKELEVLDCGELFEVKISSIRVNLISGDGGFSVLTIGELGDDLVIVSNLGVVKLAKDGTKRVYTSKSELTSASFSDERLLVIYKKSNKTSAAYFDFDKFELGDPLNLPAEFTDDRDFEPLALEGYEIAAKRSDGVWGFKVVDGELKPEMICDFVGSDIAGNSLGSFIAVSPREFWLTEYDFIRGGNNIWRLTAIPTDEYVEKTTLTLAVLPRSNQGLERAVVEYNRSNDEYRIELKVYDAVNENGGIDAETTMQQFNNDLAAGKIPDAVMLEPWIDPDIYEAQGLFCDLYEVMADAGYDSSNLLECQTESFTRKSKRTGKDYLPYLALGANVSTLVSDRKVFEGRLTLERLLDLVDEGNRPANPFSDYIMVNKMLSCDLEEFIGSDGTMSFDSGLFLRFIETTRNADYMKILEEEPIFTDVLVNNYWKLIKLKRSYEDFNFAGYPDADSLGALLTPLNVFGICEKSEHKTEAFKILETLISDEWNSGRSGTGIPVVTKSAFDKYMESDISRYHYITDKSMISSKTPMSDEHIAELKKTYGSGFYYEVTDEIIEEIRSLILSARAVSALDETILSVVWEEVSATNHTAKETAAMINDRAEIIWHEKH